MNIKDYLHLYLGCEYMIKTDTGWVHMDSPFDVWAFCHWNKYEEEIKPILRPLSDISHEEQEQFIEVAGLEPEDIDCLIKSPDDFFQGELSYGTAHLTNIAQWAQGVNYLLSKHFDLFQLIDFGLAIDVTTLLNSTPNAQASVATEVDSSNTDDQQINSIEHEQPIKPFVNRSEISDCGPLNHFDKRVSGNEVKCLICGRIQKFI
jgi:hypothetical protein